MTLRRLDTFGPLLCAGSIREAAEIIQKSAALLRIHHLEQTFDTQRRLAIASGAGLALSRISWTSPIWLVPYLMFWLWVITVAVLLLRSSFRGVARSG
jgi:hypothetical protein